MDPNELKKRKNRRLKRCTNLKAKNDNKETEIFRKKVIKEIVPIKNIIESKGGKIIYLHMPMPDQHCEILSYPKKNYWDILDIYMNKNTIHFKEYKEIENFSCPDGSHLDKRDAIMFSKKLSSILLKEYL